MANKKITDLTELTEAASDDYLEIVDTSANTSKKISLENLTGGLATSTHNHDHGNLTGLGDNDHPQYLLSASTNYPRADGWIPVSDTWTYASATTITVPSGATNIYSVGDKFRLTANSVVLQGYIVKVENKLLTVVGNALTDYTFSNISYSKSATPLGFPHWFSWTPTITWVGGTTDPTSFTILAARYVTVGNLVFCMLRGSLTRGSGDRSYLSLTAPVTISNMASGSAHHNINGNEFVLAPLYSESGKVSIFTGTMTKDGYIWASWFYEK
jgi:hypothetical protein